MTPKLTRDAAGRYHGSYGGHEFVVWKVERTDYHNQAGWLVECPAIGAAFDYKWSTRDYAIRKICAAIDEAAVNCPELDQLLARWTAEVKAVVDRLGNRAAADVQANIALLNLKTSLSWLDGSVRMHAVQFERDLAKLKALVTETGGPEQLERQPAGEELELDADL